MKRWLIVVVICLVMMMPSVCMASSEVRLTSEDGGWLHFDYVPFEQDIRVGTADYTGRLCVIGAALDEHKLAHLFDVE